MASLNPLPPPLRDFIFITEIDEAQFLAGALFKRKFNDVVPDVPRHLAAFYRDDAGTLHLLGYSHMRPFGDVYLSGGSCTNGDTVRRMQPRQAAALNAAGGALHFILQYGFARFADDCEAFFGHCGDRRALEVVQAVGFVPTEHEHLIVHWHKPLSAVIRGALIAKVHAIGAF